MAISQSELMAVTVSVLLLTLVPHTRKLWGGVGCGLQALEDQASRDFQLATGREAEDQEWAAVPWLPELGPGPLEGRGGLRHPRSLSSPDFFRVNPYKFTSCLTCCLGDRVVGCKAGSRPWAASYWVPSRVLSSCAQPRMASYRLGDVQRGGALPRGHARRTRGRVWGSIWPTFGPFHLS